MIPWKVAKIAYEKNDEEIVRMEEGINVEWYGDGGRWSYIKNIINVI